MKLKHLLCTSILLVFAGFYAFAQTVDSLGTDTGNTSVQALFDATGFLFSCLVVLFTALGTKFGFLSQIKDKWVYSIAVALVLAVAWITLGFNGFLELLTKYFPIAGTIYAGLKSTGLLKYVGLAPAAKA